MRIRLRRPSLGSCWRWAVPALLLAAVMPALRGAPPNIVLIVTDDQGSLDLNSYGAKDLETPRLDRLAAEGVRFEQFYAAAPVCSPSRAGIMTGKHPWTAGVPGNVGTTAEGLPASEKTIAEYFSEAGYATAQIGKWHLGHHEDTIPGGQGFDYAFGHLVGCIDNFSHYFYWNGPNRHDLWENGREVHHYGKFFPDLMREKALDFVKAAGEKPFLIYYAINLPHYPYQAEEKWIARYRDLPMPRKLYAAAMSDVDENIGELLDGLAALGKRENTIVCFMSDHGHSTEVRAFGGGGWAGDLRGAKFSLFEGGIRVPTIISWPGRIPEGGVRAQLATGCDWLPTLLDLAGIAYAGDGFAGKSQKAVILDDAPSPHEHFIWKVGKQRAVRKGRWKLLRNPLDTGGGKAQAVGGLVLYDLEADPSESRDLRAAHPEVVRALEPLLAD